MASKMKENEVVTRGPIVTEANVKTSQDKESNYSMPKTIDQGTVEDDEDYSMVKSTVSKVDPSQKDH